MAPKKSTRLPAIRGSTSATVKKGGKKKKTKAKSKPISTEECVVAIFPIKDPLKQFKSPYGGKLSPAEEYQLLQKSNWLSGSRFSVTEESAKTLTDISGESLHSKFLEWKIQVENQHSGEATTNDSHVNNKTTSSVVVDKTKQLNETESGFASDKGDVVQNQQRSKSGTLNTEQNQLIQANDPKLWSVSICDTSCESIQVGQSGAMLEGMVCLILTGNQLANDLSCLWNYGVSYLRHLDLQGNKITQLSATSLQLPHLVSLFVSFNPLKLIDTNLVDGIPNLRVLHAEDCCIGIESLPPLMKFANLEELQLGNNQIQCSLCEIVDLLKLTRTLRNISLKGNSILDYEVDGRTKLVATLPCLQLLDCVPTNVTLRTDVHKDLVEETQTRSVTQIDELDTASCSCVEGNPCAVKYNCKNWPKRFEVALRARENNYNLVF